MYKILIVDDHPAVRRGYTLLIQRETGMTICGEAASGQEALLQLRKLHPQLVLLDISLSGTIDGVELLRQICAEKPEVAVLVVSGHEELVYAERMVSLGARGYVMKGDAEAFWQALRQVAAGEIYLSPRLAEKRAR